MTRTSTNPPYGSRDQSASHPSMSPLQSVTKTLRRHWGKSFLFGVFVVAVSVGAIMFAPRTYSSESKLFVRVGRESVGLDPTATTGETLSVQRENEIEMNSIMELLNSRNLLENVVDTLGADHILKSPELGPELPKDEKWKIVRDAHETAMDTVGQAVQWVRQLDPISDRDRAIHELQKSIKVSIGKRSSVVSVTCKAKNPQLAHDVVEALVAAYLEEHQRVNRTDGAYEFFVEQSEFAQKQLTEATQALSDAKNELGVLSVESQRTMLHDQISTVQIERAKADAELAAAKSRAKSLAALTDTMSPRVATDAVSGHDNVAADGMRSQLYTLELRKAQLLAQYTQTHPLVAAIEQQLADAKKIYLEQPQERSRQTLAMNPTFQQLELDLFSEQGRVAALESQVAKLGEQHETLVAQGTALNTAAVRLLEMEMNVERLSADWRGQVAKLEQSRVNQALEQQRISNVNIAQPASLVARPISPNKPLLLILGLGLAIGGAFLIPFLFDRGADVVEPDAHRPKSDPPTLAKGPRQTPKEPVRKPSLVNQPVSV